MIMRKRDLAGAIVLVVTGVGSALAQQAPPTPLPMRAVDFPDYEELVRQGEKTVNPKSK